jgi:hypothetical protein
LDQPQSDIIGKAIGFLFVNFDLEFLKKLKNSETLHTKTCLILLLVGITGCMGTNRDLFHRTVLQKCGIQQLFLGLRLVSRIFEENQKSAIQTKIEQHFGGFFQQINVWQPIGRKDSKQPSSQQGSIHFCMERLRTLNSSQIFKIKN